MLSEQGSHLFVTIQNYHITKCYLKFIKLKDDDKFYKTVKTGKGSLKKPHFKNCY